MNKVTCVLSFICGAAIGAAALYFYSTKKAPATEETETDSDSFEEVHVEEETEEAIEEAAGTEEDDQKVAAVVEEIITKNGYSVGDHTNPGCDDGPYVIGSADFGEFSDYDALSLTLLSDGILVDDRMMTIDDPENTVGTNYKKYFGVYPNDPYTVYIRNDELCCDYEIVKDLRTYEEVEAQRPHLRWRDNE